MQTEGLLVASSSQRALFERQRFLVQDRFVADSLVFPGGDVAEFVIVAGAFAFAGLVFFAEVSAAGFIPLQRVVRQQFREFEEVGDASRVFQVLVEGLAAAQDFDVLPEFLSQLPDRLNRVQQSFFVASHPDVVPHDLAQRPMEVLGTVPTIHVQDRFQP